MFIKPNKPNVTQNWVWVRCGWSNAERLINCGMGWDKMFFFFKQWLLVHKLWKTALPRLSYKILKNLLLLSYAQRSDIRAFYFFPNDITQSFKSTNTWVKFLSHITGIFVIVTTPPQPRGHPYWTFWSTQYLYNWGQFFVYTCQGHVHNRLWMKVDGNST